MNDDAHNLPRAPHWQRPQAIFIVVVLIALAGNLIYMLRHQPSTAPAIELTLLDGRSVSLRSLRGRPVLILFWATYCIPCIEKFPDINTLYHSYRPQGLEIIAIAMSHDSPQRIATTVNQLGMAYPIMHDLKAEAAQAFGVRAIPASFLISAHGQIVWQDIGRIDIVDLRLHIDYLIKHPERRAI